MNVIAELETTGREVYTGAIGFASPVAGLELNVAIRTFEIAASDLARRRRRHRRRLRPGRGGRRVRDQGGPAAGARSAPAARTRPAPDVTQRGRRPAAPGPAPAPPPRPGRRRVRDAARARRRDRSRSSATSRRLRRSVRALYGAALPAQLARSSAPRRGRRHAARMRVDARPARAAELCSSMRADRAARPDAAGATRAVRRAGRHRRAQMGRPPPAERTGRGGRRREPLLCDLDGLVLEARAASVSSSSAAVLLTPPADGRILPGVTRARVLSSPPARQASRCGSSRSPSSAWPVPARPG